MSEPWEWTKNAQWVPEMKRLGRLILADRRTQTGNYSLRMRLRYGGDTELFNPAAYTPALTPQALGWVHELRNHHFNVMSTTRLVPDFGQYEILPGRTVYTTSVAPAATPQPSPNPYDEPPIQNIPPACLPCISIIVFV